MNIALRNCLLATALAFAAGPAPAQETQPATKPTATKPATPKAAGRSAVRKPKKRVNLNTVELNSATKDQLKTLPGITDPLADKIIAGRPYLSKMHLVTRNIVSRAVFEAIRTRAFVIPPQAKGK